MRHLDAVPGRTPTRLTSVPYEEMLTELSGVTIYLSPCFIEVGHARKKGEMTEEVTISFQKFGALSHVVGEATDLKGSSLLQIRHHFPVMSANQSLQ